MWRTRGLRRYVKKKMPENCASNTNVWLVTLQILMTVDFTMLLPICSCAAHTSSNLHNNLFLSCYPIKICVFRMLSPLVLCHQPSHVSTVHDAFAPQVDALNIYKQSTRQTSPHLLTPIHLYHQHLCNPCHNCLLGLQVLFHLTSSLQRLLYVDLILPTGMLNNRTPAWDMPHLDPILMQRMKTHRLQAASIFLSLHPLLVLTIPSSMVSWSSLNICRY